MRLSIVLSLLSLIVYSEVHANGIGAFFGNIVICVDSKSSKLLGNRYFLEKQRFLLEILHHVHEPLMNQQWRSLGEHLVTDKEQYVVGIRIQGTKIYD